MSPSFPRVTGAASVGRFYAFLFSTLLLGACITDDDVHSRFTPPPPSYGVRDFRDNPAYADAVELSRISPAMGTEASGAALPEPVKTKASFRADCKIKDRFDRDLTLAYRFSDGRTQLGLDVKGRLHKGEFEGVKFALKYKLSPPGKKEKTNCLYDSPVQGLIGSAYNELFERTHETVWDELDDAGLDFD